MKVAIAVFPRVTLDEFLVSFVLNQRLFSFFICISFLFSYLLSLFLSKRFILFEDSISPLLALKRTSGSKYLRMDQVKLVEDTAFKKSVVVWSA